MNFVVRVARQSSDLTTWPYPVDVRHGAALVCWILLHEYLRCVLWEDPTRNCASVLFADVGVSWLPPYRWPVFSFSCAFSLFCYATSWSSLRDRQRTGGPPVKEVELLPQQGVPPPLLDLTLDMRQTTPCPHVSYLLALAHFGDLLISTS